LDEYEQAECGHWSEHDIDPEPERHTPMLHAGNVWQDPAGWYVAACDCGWTKVTWTSIRAAADLLRRHCDKGNG
jgi:hypothetical protein